MTTNDDVTRFTVRFPNDLYLKIKELADKNKRSVTKQIEFMIEESLLTSSKEESLSNH